MQEQAALLYFVKYPTAGRVKTRLAKFLGPKQAAKVYSNLALKNYESLQSLVSDHVQVIVTFDPPEKEREIKDWLSGANGYLPQEGEDLTERLQNAFDFAFKKGFKQVMAFGSDTLLFKPELIGSGIEILKKKDVVIGPAADGGYYLIGTSSYQGTLFQDIPWSTSGVFAQTVQQMRNQNLSFELLEELKDLDEASDLDQIEREPVA